MLSKEEKGRHISAGKKRAMALLSPEERKKRMGRDVAGSNNPMYGKVGANRGKHFTKAHKNNISKALRGRIFSEAHIRNLCVAAKIRADKRDISGNNNPMYGKSGKLNPNWRGGISFIPYPLGWTKTYKEQIRHRDGYRCQLCGVPEAECIRKLPVHHIDYDKTNLKPENLVSLCIRCHCKTNFNREYWTDYFRQSVACCLGIM